MAKAYGDDLRRRILQAYEQGEGSEAELAVRFRISVGSVDKIRSQQLRTGQMKRVPHQPSRKPKFTEPIRKQLRDWVRQQPDLALAELQQKLLEQVQLGVARPSLWLVLKQIGMRLKKSHSMPANKTGKRTNSGVKHSLKGSARSRRKADLPGRERSHDPDDAQLRTSTPKGNASPKPLRKDTGRY